jgi:thiosulfate dehydrogenase [quinone] large subunit
MAKASAGGGGDRHPQASIAGMVIVRLFVGAFFLYAAYTKLADPAAFIHALARETAEGGSYIVHAAWPGFADFLRQTVAPHATLFGWLVMIGECLAGGLLFLGLLTRLAAVIAILLSATYLLATLYSSAASWGINAAFLTMEVAVLVAAAGRTCGIDRVLARHARVKLLF